MLVRMQGEGTLMNYWLECTQGQLVWRFLRKVKIKLPYHTAFPLLGLYPKECKSAYSNTTDTCTYMFIP
jgi:hypothetical protein